MTTAQLLQRIDARKAMGYGTYKVTIEFRGKQ
jgi:hypothetical protein